LSAELARDPNSLVFLDLGEALRSRGQLYLAAKVAVAGLERHGDLADAHDLYARVLVDMGHLQQARDEWYTAIETDSRHLGAHKGLGFLCYRWGDLDGALEHLETALSADPTDSSIVEALQLVRDAVEESEVESETRRSAVFAGLEGADHGLLLFETRGMVLAGGVRDATGADVSDDVAAFVAGAVQEAERTARILEMGRWQWIVAEGTTGNVHVSRPTDDSLLLVARDRSVPAGRLAILAQRATESANQWLEGQEL
jgi:predicted regulator of Ras-like GTPase activity (Roadblock/LC7/MglB family)